MIGLRSVSAAVLKVLSRVGCYLSIKDRCAGSDPLVLISSHSNAGPIPGSRLKGLHAVV
jgi:hypothetical protein